MEHIAQQEIKTRRIASSISISSGTVRFSAPYTHELLNIKSINSLFIVLYFDIPRPKALLGHQHFHLLLGTIHEIFEFNSKGESTPFHEFYVSAAGSHSSVLQRFRHEIGQALQLEDGIDNGDLQIRLKRAGKGWEALIRITPRPHATRSWRVFNFEGALNGPVASAMMQLSNPKPDDVLVNLACGSGTLMIERMSLQKANHIIGCDTDPMALACASENIRASHFKQATFQLLQADITALPLPSAFANQLVADLPFGQLVGSHQENIAQYPLIFKEAARISTQNALFTVLTHEVKLMEKLLAHDFYWYAEKVIKISLRGLHPRIYLLRKRNGIE